MYSLKKLKFPSAIQHSCFSITQRFRYVFSFIIHYSTECLRKLHNAIKTQQNFNNIHNSLSRKFFHACIAIINSEHTHDVRERQQWQPTQAQAQRNVDGNGILYWQLRATMVVGKLEGWKGEKKSYMESQFSQFSLENQLNLGCFWATTTSSPCSLSHELVS